MHSGAREGTPRKFHNSCKVTASRPRRQPNSDPTGSFRRSWPKLHAPGFADTKTLDSCRQRYSDRSRKIPPCEPLIEPYSRPAQAPRPKRSPPSPVVESPVLSRSDSFSAMSLRLFLRFPIHRRELPQFQHAAGSATVIPHTTLLLPANSDCIARKGKATPSKYSSPSGHISRRSPRRAACPHILSVRGQRKAVPGHRHTRGYLAPRKTASPKVPDTSQIAAASR